ncbi:MAG TPA: hypothetical protein ENJ32_08770, partial [Crenotrichaceae bacterium]|nr:hypothetical protein [Crenotrichaceae bacterium]
MKITRLLILFYICSFCQIVSSQEPDSGWWWNPDQSGRGFVIEQQGDAIFFAAFLYDDSGFPTWFTSLLNRDSEQDFSGVLQQFQGGQTLLGSYQPPATLTDNAGTITLNFPDSRNGILNWPGGTVELTRFTFAEDDNSSSNDNSNPKPDLGWWWNSDESGRGFIIDRQGDTIFFAAFLYEDSGLPTWFSAILNKDTQQDFSGILQQFQGGQTLTGSYQAPILLEDNAGTITLNFSDTSHGTLNWPGGTVALNRFRFAPDVSSDDNSNDVSSDDSSNDASSDDSSNDSSSDDSSNDVSSDDSSNDSSSDDSSNDASSDDSSNDSSSDDSSNDSSSDDSSNDVSSDDSSNDSSSDDSSNDAS